MSGNFATWAVQVRRLNAALTELAPLAEAIGVPAPACSDRPADREWHELLAHKLMPQLAGDPWLVAAVVGGTNIGKSLIFNHLAGEDASAVSPLAAGTKHPVCLCPPGFDDPATLERLFAGFELEPWHASADALQDSERDLLFWRVGTNVPPIRPTSTPTVRSIGAAPTACATWPMCWWPCSRNKNTTTPRSSSSFARWPRPTSR
jgi:hypothetical protein